MPLATAHLRSNSCEEKWSIPPAAPQLEALVAAQLRDEGITCLFDSF